jgi:hypothetical protein
MEEGVGFEPTLSLVRSEVPKSIQPRVHVFYFVRYQTKWRTIPGVLFMSPSV